MARPDILRNLRACDRIAGRRRGSSACQRPSDLPALRVACRCSPVGFDRQYKHAYSFKELNSPASFKDGVAKMASHAIFQYNVLAIDDTHNTWTNIIVKINIPRLLGSSDDKEKISVARPEGPPLRGFRYPVSGRGSRGSRPSRVSGQRPET